MTTYQDIADYMSKNYFYQANKYTVIKHDDYSTITNGDVTIDIYNDYYKSSLYIGTKLSHLLADLLDTPVNQRNKLEIKHTIKPVTKESACIINLITIDQVIQAINTFIVNARFNSNPTMTIVTNIGEDNLNKVLKLYDDYNIRITNQMPLLNPAAFDLLIEPK